MSKKKLHPLDVAPVVASGATSPSQFPLLAKTLILIRLAHQGQLYSDKLPYWHHPVRVVLRVKSIWSETMLYAGLLHDVIEDTLLEPRDLYALGYSPEVVSVVLNLTRVEPEPYDSYIARICRTSSVDTLLLKYADSIENTNNIGNKSTSFRIKQMEKHSAALPKLMLALRTLGAEGAMNQVVTGRLTGETHLELIAWTGTDIEI